MYTSRITRLRRRANAQKHFERFAPYGTATADDPVDGRVRSLHRPNEGRSTATYSIYAHAGRLESPERMVPESSGDPWRRYVFETHVPWA